MKHLHLKMEYGFWYKSATDVSLDHSVHNTVWETVINEIYHPTNFQLSPWLFRDALRTLPTTTTQ